MTNENEMIKIYGTTWCGDTRRAKQFFAENQIEYQWIDIDQDKDAEQYVLSVNNNCRSVPTILFPDGSILVEPSTMQLKNKFNID
jgi:mycoredoxin